MDSIYGEGEEYFDKCGEVFFTIKGNIAFHCTLCEERFKGFQDYNEHILETHYAPDFKKDVLVDSFNEEEEGPLNEEAYFDHSEDYDDSEEHKDESYGSPQHLNQVNEQVIDILEDDFKNEELNPSITNNIEPVEAIRSTIRCINLKPTIKDRKYQCPHCGFKGADRSNIRKHIRRHSLNRPHKCKECDKAFYTRTELKSHCRSHTGERPFLCDLCGKSFISSGTLSEHERSHTNTRDKECPVCKTTFMNKKALCKHMVVHSDKREYKCTLCDATFKLAESLRNHIKLHENKREYECKLCDSKFNQHAGLYSHMKSCHMVILKSSKAS